MRSKIKRRAVLQANQASQQEDAQDRQRAQPRPKAPRRGSETRRPASADPKAPMTIEALTPEIILSAIEATGGATFHEIYDLNLFGIRTSNTAANSFNDIVGCVYRNAAGAWQLEAWPATTDPGLYYREHPSRVEGTAWLVPGQYRGAYTIDLHKGNYRALCQRTGPVTVYRDADRSADLDTLTATEQTGYFGINIHRATSSGTSTEVNKWSAGCQVLASSTDFARLMDLADLQQTYHPTWTRYTYTLLTQAQVNAQR